MMLLFVFVLGCFFGLFYSVVKGYQLAKINKLYFEQIELVQELEDRLQAQNRICDICKGTNMQENEAETIN